MVRRWSPSTLPDDTGLGTAEHAEKVGRALQTFDANPDWVRWHYVSAAFKARDRNVSRTARDLGMHRNTLARMLQKKEPQMSGYRGAK